MISVIVPAYNAEKTINSTINSLLRQNFPKKSYEIILVDDGSNDKTVELASKFPIKIIRSVHKGPAFSRNLGAKKSKGDIILFIDSDCIADKNWIRHMIEPFKDSDVVGVSGKYRTLNQDSIIARFSGYEIEERHVNMEKKKVIDFIGTFSAGYRKKIFLKFGGFDIRFKTSSGEDAELSYRIAKFGYKMVFQPSAIVYHPHPDSLLKYLKQKYYRGVWRNLMYWSQHKDKLIKSDSYTKKSLLPQILITAVIPFISFILLFFNHSILSNIFLMLVSIYLVAIIFNLDLIFFIWKKEKSVAFLSTIILSLRNFAVILGIVDGLFKYFFKKFD